MSNILHLDSERPRARLGPASGSYPTKDHPGGRIYIGFACAVGDRWREVVRGSLAEVMAHLEQCPRDVLVRFYAASAAPRMKA